MKRRTFLATLGVSASVAMLPKISLGQLSLLSGEGIKKKVAELLAKMTLDEKLRQMSGLRFEYFFDQMGGYNNLKPTRTPDVNRLGIPGIRFVDGPRGVNFKDSTCFPVHIARGASWDPELEKRVGRVLGYEAKARGANYTGAVCINIIRHPSWGRSQETVGEDPFHVGLMGSSFALGIQDHIMACAKHYACNNYENSRQFVDVKIDERTLREIYIPHFKMCVDAGVASVMCAYNIVNGEYCSQNKHLLQEIMKDDWGFKGFIVSDFGAVHASEPSVNAGLDVEMPTTRYWGPRLKKLVEEGRVKQDRIDDAVTRILREKIRFGLMENQPKLDASKVGGPKHAAVALEAEKKSIVLLKNDKSALPLIRKEIKTLAVIGSRADQPNIGDRGSSVVRPAYVVTPLAGLMDKAGSGVTVSFDPGEKFDSAEKLAARADAAIVVVGPNWMDEGEAHDRVNLELSGEQEQLIKTVANANKRTIVVVEGGGAVVMESWKDKVPAIVMAWYPGMEGGNAIAEILFGDANPCGKLPLLFPKSTDQLFRFDNHARTVQYGYYHGYRWFDKKGLEPAFPFGFGLSYTNFKYANLRLAKKTVGKDEKVQALVDVTNTGSRSGEEIVQLYVGYNGTKIDRPIKDLKAFAKVLLDAGQTRTVPLEFNADTLAFYNQDKANWQIENIDYVAMIGPSADKQDLKLTDTFKLAGI